jgi:hypothetical protein
MASGTGEVQATGWIGESQDGWLMGNGTYSSSNEKSFWNPTGVCTGPNGSIYVADCDNHRVCKWTKDGNFVGWIGGAQNGWWSGSAPFLGTDYQSFNYPCAVFVDSAGDIYVADRDNHRICKWSSDGTALGYIGGGATSWTTSGSLMASNDYDHFSGPHGVCVSTSGDIYVADSNNARIVRYDSSGQAQGWIGGGNSSWQILTGASGGSDYDYFSNPMGVFVDTNGDIYVADTNNNRVSKWNASGSAFGYVGNGQEYWTTAFQASVGDGLRQFNLPTDVFVCPTGELLVCDQGNHRICRWGTDGSPRGWIGYRFNSWTIANPPFSGGIDDYNGFSMPRGVCMSSNGNIYVADAANNRISRWSWPNNAWADSHPPDPIINLQAAPGAVAGAIDLQWTAVGDDGIVGTAHHYEIRVSTSPILTEGNWTAATEYTQSWIPAASTLEQYETITLAPGPTYHFAIKVFDEVDNVSTLSNSPSSTTG